MIIKKYKITENKKMTENSQNKTVYNFIDKTIFTYNNY